MPTLGRIAPGKADSVAKILIIDDDRALLRAWQLLLIAHGYEAAVASSGQEGLRSAQTFLPDAVFLDIQMPGMDGLEVCRRMMADPQTAEIPVLIMSGNAQSEAREGALAAGAVEFLSKPLDAARVLAVLESVLATGSQRQNLESVCRSTSIPAS